MGRSRAKNKTGNPIRYFDGVVQLAMGDLESDGFGVPWGQNRTWTNGVGYYVKNNNGWGMPVNSIRDTPRGAMRAQDYRGYTFVGRY
jgi:hypothetical protein